METNKLIELLQTENKIDDDVLNMIDDWVQVRKLMRKEVMDKKSAYCPICKTKKSKYTRSLNKGMYFFLLHLTSKYNKGEWVYYETIKSEVLSKYQVNVTDYSKLSLFGLLEMTEDKDEETGLTDGYCKVTDMGWEFVRGKSTIPKHYYLIDNNVVEESSERIDFSQCQQKFKLKDLYND